MASIETLSSVIHEQVPKLLSLLQAAGSPPPTLDETGFDDFVHETDTPEGIALRQTRSQIIDAAQELLRLVRGPIEQILTLTWSAADTANLDLITRLELPRQVPLEGSISIQELAAITRVPTNILERTLRYAIANGIFVEEAPGVIRHSAVSAALVRNQNVSNIVPFGTQFMGNVLLKVPDAVLLKRDDSEHAPETAFNIAFQTDEPLFDFFHKNKDFTKKYHEYLAGRVGTPLWSVDRMRAAWSWESKGEVTVVDVGGSSGPTAQYLASLMPNAKFIVQDSNLAAMDMGRRIVDADPSVRSRISFMEYDFFTPQPVSADIYIYRHILHDWNDADAAKILSSLLPALKPGAKILISEAIVPAPPAKRLNTLASKMVRYVSAVVCQVSLPRDSFPETPSSSPLLRELADRSNCYRIEDTLMLAAHNAQERTVANFEALFQTAAPGAFRLVGVTSGTDAGSLQSLLEFEFLGLSN
ncbi:putative O-methyltransferase [Xylariaceae sp. FL0662B]|nr:putative O-methyltransferase [Xylariaceae sp. FL0662B]